MKLEIKPLGAVFKYNGVRLQVIKAIQSCRGCYFKRHAICPVQIVGVCQTPWRDENIIFRKFDFNKTENYHGRKAVNKD